jgi:CarD family transcriptional regulator
MTFDIGDKVVYPHHGAAVVARREFRKIGDSSREYLVLHMAFDDLTLRRAGRQHRHRGHPRCHRR